MSDDRITLALSPINSIWFRHIKQSDPEAKQRRLDLVTNSVALLEALAEIVEADIKGLDKTPSDDYNNPNWAYKEADRQGQRRALKNILALTQRTKH